MTAQGGAFGRADRGEGKIRVDAAGAMHMLLALAKVRSSPHLGSFEEKREWRELLASTFLIKSGSRSG